MFSAAYIAQLQACCGVKQQAPAIGIEQGAVQVGCLKDANGAVIGSVHKVVIYNEDGTFKECIVEAVVFADASTLSPYDMSLGPIEPCDQKDRTVYQDYLHKETCELHTLVTCINPDGSTTQILLNPDGTTTKDPVMSDFEPAVASPNATEKVTLEAQVIDFALTGEFNGTIADAVAAVIAAEAPVFTLPDGTEQAATADDLCAFKVTAMPCDSCFLAVPGELASETVVTVDKTFINDNKVRSDGDSEFASVDQTSTVVQAPEARSIWCFEFKLEGEVDKAGVFTQAA